MPKRAIASANPPITLDATSPLPLYKQLYERLRAAILSGQLERGRRLPSTRTLAGELGVSRNTTALAYEMLLLEGFLESQVGQGTSVSQQLPPLPVAQVVAKSIKSAQEQLSPAPVRLAAHVASLQRTVNPEQAEGSAHHIFRGGVPALDLFPYELWARLVARHARQSLPKAAAYQPPAGFYPLREAIAAHIAITRGVRCTLDQIILTAGSQGAFDLAVRTLLNPGDMAWIENPGYFGAQGALRAARAELIAVPVDGQGLDVESGRRLAPQARLASTTPSHQFPTGVTMSLNRRLALLEWARQVEAWIVEDDYDSEYRFGGRPLDALYALDRDERVLYIGTFSKTLFPSLRLGYLVAPHALIEPLLAVRRFVDLHIPILEQMALADFINEGHFARHLRQMRQHYSHRRNILAETLRAQLGALLEIYTPEAGMHLVGWLPPGKDDSKAASLAAHAGLNVTAISRYSLEPLVRGGLLFGYAGTNEEGIELGVAKLAAALHAFSW